MKSLSRILSDLMAFVDGKILESLTAMPPVDVVFYRNTIHICLAQMVGAGLLVYLTWGHVNMLAASTWLAAHWMYYAYQMYYFSQYVVQASGKLIVSDVKLWKWFGGHSAVNGILWVFGVAILYVPNSIVYQIMVFSVLIVLISGYSAITVMLCPFMFLSFAIPSAFLFFYNALHSGGEVQYIIAGILAVTVAHNMRVGLHMHRAFRETRKEKQRSQKLAEELAEQKHIAEEANLAKSTFLAAASHDLRQPVHALGLYVEYLRSGVEDSFHESINGIQSSIDIMHGLLGSLLDISMLDAGVVKPEISDFPLQFILDRVEQSMTPEAVGKGIRLRVRPCCSYVRSDQALLQSIVNNLVANAVKYTKTGVVLVACRIRNKMIRIEVWDTGSGIPEGERENIFREFYQLKHDRKGGTHGMGLGLAIVSRLGRLLGHATQLKSVYGHGSRFSVELPMTEQISIAPVLIDQSWLIAEEFAGKMVLVIDNDRSILTSLGQLLHTWGCQVVLAVSGAEGLAALEGAVKPDVVITDLSLNNGENGLDIIRDMREMLGASLRCLVITGETGHNSLIDVQSLDIKTLNKPVPPARLRRTLAELLAA